MEISEENIDIIKLSLRTAKVLGLYPFNVVNGNVKVDLLAVVYTGILFAFSIFNLFYISLSDLLSEVDIGLAEKVYIFYKISEAAVCVCSFLMSIVSYKYYPGELFALSESRNKLSKIGARINDEKIKKTVLMIYLGSYIMLSLVFIMDYCVIFVWGGNFSISIWSWLIGVFVSAYNGLIHSQFTGVFFVIGEMIAVINEQLEKLNDRKQVIPKNGKGVRYITSRNRLSVLMHIRESMLGIADEMIRNFCPVFLLMLTTTIIGVTSNLYVINKLVTNHFRGGHDLQLPVLMQSCYWCLLMSRKTWMLVSKAAWITEQVKRTAIIIHDLLIREELIELTSELEYYSLEILHRKFELTAYELFPLDFTLLASMTGAIGTFSVMLAQYKEQT